MGNAVIFQSYSSNCTQLEIGDTQYSFKPGEILLHLLRLPQALIDSLLSESMQVLSQWDQFDVQTINVFKELFKALGNEWLQNLFLLIPAAPILHFLKSEYIQATLSDFTSDDFYLHNTRLKRSNSIQKNISETSKNAAAGLTLWLRCLSDEQIGPSLSNANDISNLSAVGKQYLQAFRQNLLELNLIKYEAYVYCEALSDDQYSLPKDHWGRRGLSDISGVINPDDSKPSHAVSQAYYCNSISELAALDLYFMRCSKYRIKTCALCENLFLSRSTRQRFCSNPNPEYQNKLCKEIGPSLFHGRRLKDDDISILYNRNYKAYHRWTRASKARLEKEADKVEIKPIIDEILDKFRKWCDTAQQAKIAWFNGSLSKDDAIASLHLPTFYDRSPKYDNWRMDQRLKAGVLSPYP